MVVCQALLVLFWSTTISCMSSPVGAIPSILQMVVCKALLVLSLFYYNWLYVRPYWFYPWSTTTGCISGPVGSIPGQLQLFVCQVPVGSTVLQLVVSKTLLVLSLVYYKGLYVRPCWFYPWSTTTGWMSGPVGSIPGLLYYNWLYVRPCWFYP